MITEATLPQAIGANDRDLVAGQRVGDYEIESKLGQGGFGTVFKAIHPLIGKVVAIKVLNRQYSAQPEMVSRFVAEARSVNQIRNRFIIDIFGFGQLEDGRHYYVMEYLDGSSLADYVERNGRLPLVDAVPILRSVARALDAAHCKGIAHRDLKPENIFLAAESDGTLYPKLLDFGIAKLLVADDRLKHKTQTGAPMGTPHYMSPEQCRGRDVDHRTDIYAFGCVTFKLLTGTIPFDGDDYMEILMKQIGEAVPSAAALAPELPPAVDAVIAWMMAKDPAARPLSVMDAIRALEEAAVAGGVAVLPVTGSLALALSGHTPSGLGPLPLPRPGRGMTPKAGDLGGAATLDAGSMPEPSRAIPIPAATAGFEHARRGRGWALAAAGIALVVVVVVVVVTVNRRSAVNDAQPAQVAVADSPAISQPANPGVTREVPVPSTIPVPSTVTVTLTGLPPGTSVLGPEGELLITAAGGDTRIVLATGTAELKIGLHHATLGDGHILLTPSTDLVKLAPALTPQAGPTAVSGGKKIMRPRGKEPVKPQVAPKGPVGDDKAPGGDPSNTTERPAFGK